MAPIKRLIRKIFPKQFAEGLADSFRFLRGWFWRAYYGFPGVGQKIIAVTGTNGKTTTVSFISEMLKSSGLKTAVLTTAYYEIDGAREFNATHRTLGSQKDAQQFLTKARKANVDIVIMEITSHALVQRRVEGLKFEGVAITNLAQDHLDYHGTMEEYARAKSLAITDYDAQWVVLNESDEWFKFFKERVSKDQKLITFGETKTADIRLKSYAKKATQVAVEISDNGKDQEFDIQLIGKFNVLNAVTAYAVGSALGLDPKKVGQGLGNLAGVDGRMEEIIEGQKFRVFVDYSYASDQLASAIEAGREIAGNKKVAVVFGATGDRDQAHWKLMGEGSVGADKIYLTDDETYLNDPDIIRKTVMEGIESKGTQAVITEIADRKEAIKTAFEQAETGEIIILAGLGHQDYRNMGGKKLVWKEASVARQLLRDIR